MHIQCTCSQCITVRVHVHVCVYIQECVDPCCNTTSCQLVAGAECRSGPCCKSDCQLRPYGSVCREKSNECDIEEYCTEESADCPRDHFVQNLSPCMNNESFCFSGHCQTRENQCQHHFNTGLQTTTHVKGRAVMYMYMYVHVHVVLCICKSGIHYNVTILVDCQQWYCYM